jgi:hypothetical protein
MIDLLNEPIKLGRLRTVPRRCYPGGEWRSPPWQKISIGFASIACLGSGQHLGFLLRSDVDDDVPMAQAVVKGCAGSANG